MYDAANMELMVREYMLRLNWLRQDAVKHFRQFLPYINKTYDRQWFHAEIADYCQRLYEGEIKNLMVFMPPQHGKALYINTPVWTTSGWKRHGDLDFGDYVYGQDGQPKRVLANSGAYLWRCKRVNFASGLTIYAAPEHEWVIKADHDDHKGRVTETIETQHIFSRRHRRAPYIDIAPALSGGSRELPIDPYILGLWLGDGVSASGYIISGGQDIAHYRDLNIGDIRRDQGKDNVYIIRVDGLFKKLRIAGLLHNKHIPLDYLTADEQSRWSLLQGLMDTEGTCDKRGNCEFTQKKGRLADDVYTLLRTLGIKARIADYHATIGGKDCGMKTRIFFNPNRHDKVFRLQRKAERLQNKVSSDRCDKLKFFINSVEDAEPMLMNCIQVEGGMYLASEDMIPTHNSEIVSRQFPAWALGKNPDLKVVGCSYSSDLAQQFSRSIQRTLDTEDYQAIFPDTRLNGSNVRSNAKGYLRNVDQFECVGRRGFYKAVGVGGSLTGTPVDIAIIDDPVKDALEAYSATYRERVWEWYTSVLLTRLHNNSRQLFIMTRWHEDDLAGRILEREADKWTVLSIPALRESLDDGNTRDPRKVGEALWEARHAQSALLAAQRRSPRVFASLYQQRPTIEGGNIVRRDWFKRMSAKQFGSMRTNEPIVFFLDTAYTDKTANDPSGIIATCRIGNEVYITNARKVHMKFPDLLRFIPQYAREQGYTNASSIRIEPKANGLSVIDQLREVSRLNVVATPSPSDSKETRLNAASPVVESGRVVLIEGAWNEEFIDEVCGFPAKPHDEYVDVLCYAINYHLDNPFKPIDKARTARLVY